MKELSLFLLKNSFGSKMKKGFKNFCNGENSTSTLNHQHKVDDHPFGVVPSSTWTPPPPLVNSPTRLEIHPTLEEMIMQLEMEEKMARRKAKKLEVVDQHRMSCVNSSDILRSARNALNQYPRFSLDGKDAMYRSSFTNLAPISRAEKSSTRKILPAMVGGESVVWCKPGVVGKLMGLDAMPMPLNSTASSCRRERLSAIIKRQNLRKRAEQHEMERRRLAGSCSRTGGGYCHVMKPVDQLEVPNGTEAGWPMRRFR